MYTCVEILSNSKWPFCGMFIYSLVSSFIHLLMFAFVFLLGLKRAGHILENDLFFDTLKVLVTETFSIISLSSEM